MQFYSKIYLKFLMRICRWDNQRLTILAKFCRRLNVRSYVYFWSAMYKLCSEESKAYRSKVLTWCLSNIYISVLLWEYVNIALPIKEIFMFCDEVNNNSFSVLDCYFYFIYLQSFAFIHETWSTDSLLSILISYQRLAARDFFNSGFAITNINCVVSLHKYRVKRRGISTK